MCQDINSVSHIQTRDRYFKLACNWSLPVLYSCTRLMITFVIRPFERINLFLETYPGNKVIIDAKFVRVSGLWNETTR